MTPNIRALLLRRWVWVSCRKWAFGGTGLSLRFSTRIAITGVF
jgi:hypothetical protein